MCKIIGIDISKQTFDVGFFEHEKWHHMVFKNTTSGFKQLEQHLDATTCLVMEASGPYYVQLAMHFYAKGYNVSVLNPLVIRRYSQTKLYRAKTDKKDAQTIAEYGSQYELQFWKPVPKNIQKLQQLYTAISLLDKEMQQSKRQLESFEATGLLDRELRKVLTSIIRTLKTKKEKLEALITAITAKHYSATLERLQTIPGIGAKTATMLMVISNDFEKFSNYKQLIAYVGFSPRLYQSGTSVRGKGHICKLGKSQIRKLLYLCTWSAKKYNQACIDMYNRLKEKGKPERVIKIALANKLLKQVFAIMKNNTTYDENFVKNTCF